MVPKFGQFGISDNSKGLLLRVLQVLSSSSLGLPDVDVSDSLRAIPFYFILVSPSPPIGETPQDENTS
jgi:hypothetical protein